MGTANSRTGSPLVRDYSAAQRFRVASRLTTIWGGRTSAQCLAKQGQMPKASRPANTEPALTVGQT